MSPHGRPFRYPETARVDQVDDYHGTLVEDPYRWLEDLDSDDTAAWVERQNELTFAYLEQIPYRDRIRARLTELWDHDKYGTPFKRGHRYFWMRQHGLQNQFVVEVADSLDDAPRVLLDPNAWSEDGTIALTGFAVSRDGSMAAYGTSSAGSDWQEWRIVEVATGRVLDDHLRWVKFSTAAWLPDGGGFFYSRYDEPGGESKLTDLNEFQKLYLHRIGTSQDADVLVYERPDEPKWAFMPATTDDDRYLIITVWRGTDPKRGILVKDLADPEAPIQELTLTFDALYDYVANEGETMYLMTDLDAPNRRVISMALSDPQARREVIPETTDALQGVSCVGGRFFASYLRHAHSDIRAHEIDGTPLGSVELPGIGTAVGFEGRRDDEETFYLFTGFTVPPSIYRYDVGTGESTLLRRPQVFFDPDAFVTEQVFVTSPDGTTFPLFLTYKRGLERNGSTPTYLYGYGGFNISMTPVFSVAIVLWMEMGGIFAQACTRGGSEYGEEWHQAGTKQDKQNVFDDFIAAAEWLIAQGYTSTPRLAIGGGSNGGLLVGACITQRPDLFAAARAAVGVLDMLRFHRFTIGWGWVSDYGSPDDPEEFKALYAYSPLHNVREGERYPALLVTTADHDDRVVPSHSFKFVSTMQRAQGGDAPVLARIDVRAGHGMGKPTDKIIEEATDAWAFIAHELGLEDIPL